MNRAFKILTALVMAGWAAQSGCWPVLANADERPLRVAVIGLAAFAGEYGAARAPGLSLREAFERDSRVRVIEQSQLQPALTGIGYDGSTNMSTMEARRVGAAIGCDFFIVGRAETLTRSEREKQSHEEAIIAVMIVDGRGGTLAVFDFISEKGVTAEAAVTQALKNLAARATGYIDRMSGFRAARERVPAPADAEYERIELIPDEGSAQASGFNPPEFLNRVKPEYGEQAARANISATVEALAVFRADGRVGQVDVTRWAGYGLDEAALDAIRRLKFKPATRDGRPVSVRALVRYNFRRVEQPTRK